MMRSVWKLRLADCDERFVNFGQKMAIHGFEVAVLRTPAMSDLGIKAGQAMTLETTGCDKPVIVLELARAVHRPINF